MNFHGCGSFNPVALGFMLAGISLANVTPLMAQGAPSAAASAAPSPAQCGIPGHHALLERMSNAFVLTCEQEQKLEPLLHDEESVSKPLLRFEPFSADEKKAVMQEVKVAARRQIRPLLTAEQQKKMDAEIETVSKGGSGLQGGGGGKAGGSKKAEAAVDPFLAEESLSEALQKYSALSDAEKKDLISKVKKASRRPDAPVLTPEQAKKIDADIQQMP